MPTARSQRKCRTVITRLAPITWFASFWASSKQETIPERARTRARRIFFAIGGGKAFFFRTRSPLFTFTRNASQFRAGTEKPSAGYSSLWVSLRINLPDLLFG